MVKRSFFNENEDENENSMMIMEKKEYIAPECEIIELEGTVYMQAASFDKGPSEEEDEESQPGWMSNRHRGEWGNLWGNKK